MSIRVKEGQSVTLSVAGADLTMEAAAITRLWIDRLMAQSSRTSAPVIAADAWGKVGEATWGEGTIYAGIMRGKDRAPDYHLFLLAAKPEHDLAWADAVRWAEEQGSGASLQGGAASLPTRKEQALLFANLSDHFDGVWYWSSEQSAGYDEYAWCQHFNNGRQYYYHKSAQLRVRAVRRLPIE